MSVVIDVTVIFMSVYVIINKEISVPQVEQLDRKSLLISTAFILSIVLRVFWDQIQLREDKGADVVNGQGEGVGKGGILEGYGEDGWKKDPEKKGPYMTKDHEFAVSKFHYNEDIGADMMMITSRAKVNMTDERVQGILNTVGSVLDNADKKRIHYCAMYDLRHYQLPGPRAAYARAKQLVKWSDSYAELIDRHTHSVAVIIPSGFGAKLLKNCVNFVIWATQPPMDPRIFEDKASNPGIKQAVEFLKKRKARYDADELFCKPCEVGQTFECPPGEDIIRARSDSAYERDVKKGRTARW